MAIWKSRVGRVNERHVNRQINVWGSGGARNTYFKIDKIIIDLFNLPIKKATSRLHRRGVAMVNLSNMYSK